MWSCGICFSTNLSSLISLEWPSYLPQESENSFQSFIHFDKHHCIPDMYQCPNKELGIISWLRPCPPGAQKLLEKQTLSCLTLDESKHKEEGDSGWGWGEHGWGQGFDLRVLTRRVVIEGVSIFLRAIASKKSFVVVVLIPVKRLDLQSPALGMATNDARHSLVYLGGRAGAIHIGQKHHLLPHVAPATHAEQLMSATGKKRREKGRGSKGQSECQDRAGKKTPYFLLLFSSLALSVQLIVLVQFRYT